MYEYVALKQYRSFVCISWKHGMLAENQGMPASKQFIFQYLIKLQIDNWYLNDPGQQLFFFIFAITVP